MDKIKDNGLGSVEDLMRLDGAYEGEEYMKEEDEDESLTLEELDRLDSDTPVSEETSDEENAPSTPESTETVRVVSIAFRNEGKRLILCPKGMNLRTGDNVIVETARGLSLGSVAMPPVDFPSSKVQSRDDTIIRVATDIDMDQEAENRMNEREAFLICRQKISDHGLLMNLVQS